MIYGNVRTKEKSIIFLLKAVTEKNPNKNQPNQPHKAPNKQTKNTFGQITLHEGKLPALFSFRSHKVDQVFHQVTFYIPTTHKHYKKILNCYQKNPPLFCSYPCPKTMRWKKILICIKNIVCICTCQIHKNKIRKLILFERNEEPFSFNWVLVWVSS